MKAGRSWDVLVGIVPAVALVPLLIYEAVSLWNHDYMRFVPLTLVGLIWIVSSAFRSEQGTQNPIRRWTAILIFTLGAVVSAFGGFFFLPAVGHFGLGLTLFAWALGRFANLPWAVIAGWLVLFLTTIRPPWNIDIEILRWLHGASAWATVYALDALGVPCICNGSLIETRELSIMVDEFCGGAFSIFALFSFAIFISLLHARSLLCTLLVLASVPLWNLLRNFLILFAATVSMEYYDRDLTNGWDYFLLTSIATTIGFGLCWLFSHLVANFFQPIPVADAEFGPVFSALNKVFCWPHPDPLEEVEPEDEDERKSFLKQKEAAEQQKTSLPTFHWQESSMALWIVRLGSVFAVLTMFVPLQILASQGVAKLQFGLPTYELSDFESLADADALPVLISEGWNRIDFKTIQRGARSRLGQFGFVWTYSNRQEQFDASLNLPFIGWSNPVEARRFMGWTEETQQWHADDGWAWCESELSNELGGKAYILYCHVDQFGEIYNGGVEDQNLDLEERPESTSVITYQFQVFLESGDELSRARQIQLSGAFLTLRQAIRTKLISLD